MTGILKGACKKKQETALKKTIESADINNIIIISAYDSILRLLAIHRDIGADSAKEHFYLWCFSFTASI